MKKLRRFIPFVLLAVSVFAFFIAPNIGDAGLGNQYKSRLLLPPAFHFTPQWNAAQTFTNTAGDTWYKPPGVERVLAIVAAAGGGGSSATADGGGGGSGGECAIEEVDVRGTTSETITIGTGGVGGAAAGNNAGTAGGVSSFGALVTALGGNGATGGGSAPGMSTGVGGGNGGRRGDQGGTTTAKASPGAFGLQGNAAGAASDNGGGGGGSYSTGGNGGADQQAGFNGLLGGGGGGAGGDFKGGDGGDGIVIIIPLVSNDTVLTLLKYKTYMLARWISDIFSATDAIAGETKIYAEIVGSTVKAFHTRTDSKVPVFHPSAGITVIEVTGLDPMPKQRWKYNGTKFSLPDPLDPQIAIDNKIRMEMNSTAGRAAAVVRLKDKGSLAADYGE